jgi:hypothetical protein
MLLHSGFRNHFILHPLCSNALIILVLFYQIFWNVEFMRTSSQHPSAFFFPFSICCVTCTFPLMLKTFLLFMTVAMLSHYQSPVNCRGRNVEENIMHKVNYHYYCHFPGLEFMYLPESIGACPLKDKEMVEFSK